MNISIHSPKKTYTISNNSTGTYKMSKKYNKIHEKAYKKVKILKKTDI